jgi:hypothetical protein
MNSKSDELAAKMKAPGTGIDPSFKRNLTEQVAVALQLTKVIDELGGAANMTAWQLGKAYESMGLLLDIAKLGGAAGAEALTALDSALLKVLEGTTSASGLFSQAFLDMVDSARTAGLELKDVGDIIAGQLTNAQTGFAAALGVTSTAYTTLAALQKEAATATGASLTELNAKIKVQQDLIAATGIKSQESAAAVAGALAGIVASQMASGVSFIDAIKGIEPSVTALQAQLKATGFEGGEAFDFIKREIALAKDEIAGPALDAIHGYTQGLVGLSNAGVLDQETFRGIADQVGATEAALLKQGYSGSEVMVAMQNDLQAIWELQERYEYTVDDTTQALIDQGVESGLIGEQRKSMDQQQLDVLLAIAEVLGAKLPQALGTFAAAGIQATDQIKGGLDEVSGALISNGGIAGGLNNKLEVSELAWAGWGEAAQTAALEAQYALDAMKAPKIPNAYFKIIGEYEIPEPPSPGESYGATGGLVTPHGIQRYMVSGGPVGTDTVNAWLTPGERVLSVDQNKSYERGSLDMGSVVRELQDLKAEMRWQRRTVPAAIRDALQRSRAL